jgi:cation:H+ antiporter
MSPIFFYAQRYIQLFSLAFFMFLSFAALLFGLIFLVISADHFVDGAAVCAKKIGISPLIIGMVIVGFGTSAPELLVSLLAALQENPGIALGNAYGSNITNIGLILGLTAILAPISVNSSVFKREFSLLILATFIAILQLLDGSLSRVDGIVLLVLFAVIMIYSVWRSRKENAGSFNSQLEQELNTKQISTAKATFKLATGLLVLIGSSRILVWGAVNIASQLGVSDELIGLTIVAFGTSLPELASSLTALKKGEHDIALGNVIGSNLFNTLAVVGIAGSISQLTLNPNLLVRDISTMSLMTILLLFLLRPRKTGSIIPRQGGILLLSIYILYNSYLLLSFF